MHYVKHFNINGVDTKQVACIELHGKPNAATEGAVGVLGIDMDSPSREMYKCVAVNGSVYTWELLFDGSNIMSAIVSGMARETVGFRYLDLLISESYKVKVGDLILDTEGYLYRVFAISSEDCSASYCGTQLVIGGGEINTDELDKRYANALIGNKSGNDYVLLDDVSPLEHEMSVKVTADTEIVPDISAVKLYKQGKNLFNVSKVSNTDSITNNGDGSLSVKTYANVVKETLRTLCPVLKAGDVVFISMETTGANWVVLGGAQQNIGKPITITDAILDGAFNIYGKSSGDDRSAVIKNIQIEYGTAATTYEPYIEPIEYPVNSDGTVSGITSAYPNTTIISDTAGVTIECKYNRDINQFDNRYFVKHTYHTSYRTVPILDESGKQDRMLLTSTPTKGYIPIFDNNSENKGIMRTNTPTADLHCANKKYVDENCGWKLYATIEQVYPTGFEVYIPDEKAAIFRFSNGQYDSTAILAPRAGSMQAYSTQFRLLDGRWAYVVYNDGACALYSVDGTEIIDTDLFTELNIFIS